ncbi:MAG: hypothetical protein AAGA80_22480 [Cyanobacteria bacterium P01_F01_bin.143]
MIYALHNSNSRQHVGLHTSILETTRKYRKAIPVDYLAKLYSRTREEIQPYLENLEEAGLIKISTKGNQHCVKYVK